MFKLVWWYWHILGGQQSLNWFAEFSGGILLGPCYFIFICRLLKNDLVYADQGMCQNANACDRIFLMIFPCSKETRNEL